MQTPATNACGDTGLLVHLATLKHDTLSQLDVLSRRQIELIDAGEMSELLNLLAAKQRLLAELKELGRQLAPFGNQDPLSRRWTSPADRQRCAQLLAASDALFAQIMENEKQGETLLRQRRDQAAAHLRDAHAAGQARCAYAPSAPAASRLDVSSNL